MKKYSFIFLALLIVIIVALTAVACETVLANIQIDLNNELPFVLNVGDEVDFTKYFSITSNDGKIIEVTEGMLDLSNVDLTKEGTFTIECSYGEKKVSATFTVTVVNAEAHATVTVKADAVLTLTVGDVVDFKSYFEVVDKDGNAVTVTDEMLDLSKVDLTKSGTFDVVCTYDEVSATASITVNDRVEPLILTFEEILEKYADTNNWNFMINSDIIYNADENYRYQETFGYNKDALIYIHMNEGDATDSNLYTDYVMYDAEKDEYTYYFDLANGTYQTATIAGADYGAVYYPELFLDDLVTYEYTKEGDHYVAVDPQKVGDGVYGSLDGCVYTKVEVYTGDNEITKIVFYSDEEYDGVVDKCVSTFTFDEFGKVDFNLADLIIAYGNVNNDAELKEILDKYSDKSTWNFGMDAEVYYDNVQSITCGFAYANDGGKSVYLSEGILLTDYMVYDASIEGYVYYEDNGDGTHTKIGTDNEYYFEYMSSMYPVYLWELTHCLFEKVDDHYEAVSPLVTGNALCGAYENCVYTSVELYTEGGYVTKLVLSSDEEDEQGAYKAKTVFDFSGYSEQTIDVSGLTVVDGGGEGIPDTPAENPQEFVDLINAYSDYNSWNFAVNVKTVISVNESYDDFYWYMGQTIKNAYEAEDGLTYTDYLVYDEALNDYYFLADFGAEGYEKYDSDTMEYSECVSYMYYADPNLLLYYEFELKEGKYYAVDPVSVGNTFIGELDNKSYGAFIVTVDNGKIRTIEGHLESGEKFVYEFSDYGTVSFELPDLGGGSDTPVEGTTTTFVSAGLGVGPGELEYTSSIGANSLDETRGLQFLQQNGAVVLTSKLSVDNVTGISVVVQTNADLGMVVSVKVGGTSLTSNGEAKVTVEKTEYTVLVTVTFISATSISGNIEITLEPTQNKKSMYLKSITVATESANGGNPGGGDDPIEPTPENVMENQNYNPDTFDKDNLQDKLLVSDEAIGLPSIADDLHVLVIPVQFKGDTITSAQLDNLQKTFNGTAEDTGWESVASYYSKTSYGKLNMTFDIQGIFQAQESAKFYEDYYDEATFADGSSLILKEALSYYDNLIDYSKYDTNGDGCIDSVYIIYSAPVDFTNGEFYWAYCTTYMGEEQYDSKYAYYYMFAGFDFMDDEKAKYGVTLNAMTYIHETGHLLGLDDYYDYEEGLGSDETMGGADMMDYNTGDHCSYSKIMLGWTDANIVTETKTITINSFEKSGDCILVPLSFNNSYFSEYLLIDLYTATGLNELEANLQDSLLYDGAKYGVRITHVSSQIDAPCSDERYISLTNYNNSITDIALIETVEADGENNFESTKGVASMSDLWGTGDVFSEVFPSYTRNDGKIVNFDITIVSVSADSATITITYNL